MNVCEIISEINRIAGGVPIDANKYKHYFKNTNRVPAIHNLEYSNAISEYDSHFLGLFHKDDLVSCIQLDYREFPYIQLTSTITNNEWRRRGCFRFLITMAVNLYKHVLSDDSQSSDAEGAWKGLINNPGNLKIDIYDTKHDEFIKLDLAKIWDHKYALLLHATM